MTVDSINPITRTDYPDPDIIRVGDIYYMISTTMYFMPGGVILRSYDLVNWEIATYIFDSLDGTDSERFEGETNNYGKGMWAATLRYHEGKFYAAFVSHGRSDTHLFIADSIDGPWEHKLINEYFHDCSLLFDDDGRTYIVSGNTDIRLTELDESLTHAKEGGIDKIIIRDNRDEVRLGYEGSHFYKINGRYYITLIHWPHYNGRRTEAVFVSDNVDGPYEGMDVMWDDLGLLDNGAAQGGIVDTPDGKWYAMLFQDSGAVGRVPVLMPVTWEDGNKFPLFGVDGLVPGKFEVPANPDGYTYEPLFTSDDFDYEDGQPILKKQWQWNHVPNDGWEIKDKSLRITTKKICVNPVLAQNTLTQRMKKNWCQATVTVDGSEINDGDYAGLIALQGCYSFIGITREDGKYYLVKFVRTNIENPNQIGYTDLKEGELVFKKEIFEAKVDIRIRADFTNMIDLADSYYFDEKWEKIGESHKLKFGIDHFTGARFGLCVFSTKAVGGTGVFEKFEYEY